jgi:hypothetical protein
MDQSDEYQPTAATAVAAVGFIVGRSVQLPLVEPGPPEMRLVQPDPEGFLCRELRAALHRTAWTTTPRSRGEGVVVTRRAALLTLVGIAAPSQPQATTQTCTVPHTLLLGLGAGACSVREIKVTYGSLTARITPQELMEALGAKVE